jgi:hypothetical protein
MRGPYNRPVGRSARSTPQPDGPSRTTGAARAAAVAEVALAFALMHLAFRAFKRFTAPGRWEVESGVNFSPGVAMIVVALAMIAVRRWPGARSMPLATALSAHGITPRPFMRSVKAAILCLTILAATGLALRAAGAPIARPPLPAGAGLALAGVYAIATLALLWALRAWSGWLDRMPRPAAVLFLLAIPAAPLLGALARDRPVGPEAATVLWLLIGAGMGEEIFFRGYVQSRLNQAFGRPWRLLGVPFGPGLLGAAALFGLVHVLNTVDYFEGVYRPAWWHGVATGAALYTGFLRERTGSVVAPAIVHGYGDLLIRLPAMLRGG